MRINLLEHEIHANKFLALAIHVPIPLFDQPAHFDAIFHVDQDQLIISD